MGRGVEMGSGRLACGLVGLRRTKSADACDSSREPECAHCRHPSFVLEPSPSIPLHLASMITPCAARCELIYCARCLNWRIWLANTFAAKSETPQPATAAQCSCGQHANNLTITLTLGQAIAVKRSAANIVREMEQVIANLKEMQKATALHV